MPSTIKNKRRIPQAALMAREVVRSDVDLDELDNSSLGTPAGI